jgi:hypothetical protein
MTLLTPISPDRDKREEPITPHSADHQRFALQITEIDYDTFSN